MPEVIVIGAGPVGLLMAAELQRRGVSVEILEQRAAPGHGSRAIGVHPPVLAALEDSGLTAGLLDHALRVPRGEARSHNWVLGTVRFDRLSTRFPFVATLPQAATEQVLAAAAPEPRRGVGVTAIRPAEKHVQLDTDTAEERAPLVVLAGGARSRELVYRRPAAHTYPDRYLMTDANVSASSMTDDDDATTAVVHLDTAGVLESFPLPRGRRRFVAWDSSGPPGGSAQEQSRQARLQRALTARGIITDAEPATGTTTGAGVSDVDMREFGVRGFGVRRFVAPQMRNGRLFVIGDAAHEVSPIGGQGMNLGLLDALTLAPLLAAWVRTGTAAEAELHRWERARISSARRAAALAGMNTRLGRPASSGVDAVRRSGLRMMLGPGAGRLFARAYAMGFDTHFRWPASRR